MAEKLRPAPARTSIAARFDGLSLPLRGIRIAGREKLRKAGDPYSREALAARSSRRFPSVPIRLSVVVPGSYR